GLEARERETLEALLDDGTAMLEGAKGAVFIVVPRLGTLSPWSSKATDIARNCGLAAVRRIERGMVYYLDSNAPALAGTLHDRMTQTVLRSFEEAPRLFQHVPARELKTVPVSRLQEANQ